MAQRRSPALEAKLTDHKVKESASVLQGRNEDGYNEIRIEVEDEFTLAVDIHICHECHVFEDDTRNVLVYNRFNLDVSMLSHEWTLNEIFRFQI